MAGKLTHFTDTIQMRLKKMAITPKPDRISRSELGKATLAMVGSKA